MSKAGGSQRRRGQWRVQRLRFAQRRRILHSCEPRTPQRHIQAHQRRSELQRQRHGRLHGRCLGAFPRPHQYAGRARADEAVLGVRAILPDQVPEHDGGGAPVSAQPREGQAEGGVGELWELGLYESSGGLSTFL